MVSLITAEAGSNASLHRRHAPDQRQHPLAHRDKLRARLDRPDVPLALLARERAGDAVDDPSRSRRHHHDVGSEIDRLLSVGI
jgi:hypothetical protein